GRHTRSKRDWSSDVCSSDLVPAGKITAPARPGRALARLDGIGLSNAVHSAVTGPDGEVPASLRAPLEQMLKEWAPPVEAIVAIDSATRPGLVRHLAAGVSALLGVPVLGAIRPRAGEAEPTSRDVNSAHRLLAVARRLELPDVDAAGKSVLPLDAATYPGWPLTPAPPLRAGPGAS